MGSNKSIVVQGVEIHLFSQDKEDYISLTDMVSGFEGGSSLIEAWLRNKDTIEFLGVWERINNPNFNSPEFEGITAKAGLNRFRRSAGYNLPNRRRITAVNLKRDRSHAPAWECSKRRSSVARC